MPDAVSLCLNDWYKFGVDWNKTGFYSSPGQCARSELANATSPATGELLHTIAMSVLP